MPIILPSGGGSGGSLPQPALASYESAFPESIPDNTFTQMTWADKAYGNDYLDIVTAPTQPTFLSAGVYAIAVNIICITNVAGAWALGNLSLSTTASEFSALAPVPMFQIAGAQAGVATPTMTRYMAVGTDLFVAINQNTGAAKDFYFQAYIQRLS